jgi:hypothetical protein
VKSYPAAPRFRAPLPPALVPQICLNGLVLTLLPIGIAESVLAVPSHLAVAEPRDPLKTASVTQPLASSGHPSIPTITLPSNPAVHQAADRPPSAIDIVDRPPAEVDDPMVGRQTDTADTSQNLVDDDLGGLPIRPIPTGDDDFGELPIRPIPPPPPPAPKWLFGAVRLDYFSSSNAFSTTNKQADGLIRSGLGVTAIPRIGPKTYFLGGIDGNLVRYGKYAQLNYDELRLRAGILQQLSPRMYGEIGWSNQKLYTAKDGLRNILGGSQFLNENAIRLELSRNDPLSQRLSLTSFYQLRWNLSNRTDSDRLSNTLFESLNYRLSPSWSAALDYQLSWSHYTQVNRDEVYQQVQLRTQYAIAPKLTMSLFGGFSFGGSSDDRQQFGITGRERLQYDGWAIGVNLLFNQGLF